MKDNSRQRWANEETGSQKNTSVHDLIWIVINSLKLSYKKTKTQV